VEEYAEDKMTLFIKVAPPQTHKSLHPWRLLQLGIPKKKGA
jgi:hypothetical protein